MQEIETFEDKVYFLQKIFTQRFGCDFLNCRDDVMGCQAISVTIKGEKRKCLKFEGIVFAYIKEFLQDYDIYQIIKRKSGKIMIFYPKEFC